MAKGLPASKIFWKHGLKNISVTLLTVTGLLFNRLLGGTVVIEAVFAISGMGSLVVSAATGKDYPVVQGVMLTMVLIVITINLAIEILYALLIEGWRGNDGAILKVIALAAASHAQRRPLCQRSHLSRRDPVSAGAVDCAVFADPSGSRRCPDAAGPATSAWCGRHPWFLVMYSVA